MKNVAPQNEVDQAPAKVDAVGKVESYGIEYIPDEDRHSRPRNLLWILFGGSMTFGIIVIGWIPVSLGSRVVGFGECDRRRLGDRRDLDGPDEVAGSAKRQ